MKIAVVSGFNPRAYNHNLGVAKRFLKTFNFYWPIKIPLYCYIEEPVDFEARRVIFRDLFTLCPDQKKFIDDYQDNPAAWGWIHPGRKADNDFKAIKFSRQAFIPDHAIQDFDDGDIFVWLDSDVVSFKKIPYDFVPNLLGDHDMVTTGARAALGKSTDIGFWAIRVNRRTRRFIKVFADFYRGGGLFKLDEWHSGFVFDHTVKKVGLDLKELYIAPRRPKCHVWFKTPLGDYMDHVAGARKQIGYSQERLFKTMKRLGMS